MKRLIFGLSFLILTSCSTSPSIKKTVIDSTGSKPSWLEKGLVWEQEGKIYFRNSQTINGNERLDACNDLAKLGIKESLISEIQNEIKGTIDNTQQSISEAAELILAKSRSSAFAGKISGLRFISDYFERYIIQDKERITCQVLAEIEKANYDKTKKMIIEKVEEVDPALKKAITDKQINFFK